MTYQRLIKKIILFSILLLVVLFFSPPVKAQTLSQDLSGRILLQVEEHGEAWYVYPENLQRYYLGRPQDAFVIMQKLSLGVKSDFLKQTYFPARVAGRILLDVESNGEAYYIDPQTLLKHYLARPDDAFSLMRKFGLGISNQNLGKIKIGDLKSKVSTNSKTSFIIPKVPFTTQAPYGAWSDPRQQDGCEEASALMAVYWAKGRSLSAAEALRIITELSDYLEDKYGEYRDINTKDALAWIYQDYFKYDKVRIKENVSLEDIIAEIKSGNLVVAPLNGQIIGNPYYVAPGPMHHALVITGYLESENIFITHDPGTRHGQDYRYDANVLYEGIADYPTGYHQSFNNIEKNIIVVEK